MKIRLLIYVNIEVVGIRGYSINYLSCCTFLSVFVSHSVMFCFFLQLMISGLGKIDLEDWKAHTRLKHCSNETTIVKWFWQAVEEYDEEKRARLLQFVTGSSRVPLQGFKALQGQ